MSQDKIIIKGARQHNLKNIDLEIPRNKLTVITGLSGSGKSSLAFDTIYAEGQRRYVESLSAYARQFLGLMDKPDVDYIEGLSPAISIDQKSGARNPRSTVATVTEIYDYLRLLYARIGHPHCPVCGKPISKQTVDQIADQVLSLPEGTRFSILAPLVRGRKGEHEKVFEDIQRAGYLRVRVDGRTAELGEFLGRRLEKQKKHTIEVVVDRLVQRPGIRARLVDSLEAALALSGNLVVIEVQGSGDMIFSQSLACPDCGVSIPELEPRLFSFNSPYGACPACNGLGINMEIDPEMVIPDKRKSIADGAVVPWNGPPDGYYAQLLEAVARHFGFSVDAPIDSLSPEHLKIILYGAGEEKIPFHYESQYGRYSERLVTFEGVIPNLERRYKNAPSDDVRQQIEEFMAAKPCPVCEGRRLKPEALAVTVGGLNIAQLTDMPVQKALDFISALELTPREELIAHQVLKQIRSRLQFLIDVGLGYLTLNRHAGTLSGGEAQRIRLATQIGSGLVGVLYVLDEPSVGLHPRDNARLLDTIKHLRDIGNTVIVVEHDEETIRSADYIVDIGPGAGETGGKVVVSGSLEEVMKCEDSLTGQYLSGKRSIPVPRRRRQDGRFITIKGAREHNLKNIDVKIPLGVFTCVTGVSGSGKSTLIDDILYRKLSSVLHGTRLKPGEHDGIEGLEYLDKVINIDQSPIGRTPRSNPATYTGVFTDIRNLFAMTPEARVRGYKPGRFSFNVRGGRCEACKGDGIIRIEMQFLPDVYVPCEVCHGKRYNSQTLEVKYRGKSIADVLDMTVEEALDLFKNVPAIQRKLQTLYDVGLGYIKLGQPATTLSGGEAQRVKLATELSRRGNERTLYILDEPTTGLHFEDTRKLLDVLQRLVDGGSTVVVIEHNLDVIKSADYVIDLGPEGGEEGGYVVAVGTPEEVALCENSYTGQFLRKVLGMGRAAVPQGEFGGDDLKDAGPPRAQVADSASCMGGGR
ncbi:MAG: excinuclease ABC subunit UvrA [Candidatus Fermentithermobacillus carboniphilus]|uniref:UvrABC system protein A n=1 Tax=Candidatus Fermentithermobacillus carboniphilus TaxID=3085328 RepID=A0AAT9LA57_9FIRM|nr:MAG: excinuclease ABC subunit UvrA [Candidatus Fermentithermobacillus carboniphilus]